MSTEDGDLTLFSSNRKRKSLKKGTSIRSDALELPPSSKKAKKSDADVRQADAAGALDTSSLPSSNDGSTFESLGISPHLQRLCSSLARAGIRPRWRPVQAGVIPAVLSGRDVIGVAHTGSGKTAAFALPLIHKLSRDPYGIFAVTLTPTRELAYQIADQFAALGNASGVRHATVVGGMDQQAQSLALLKRPHVVVATPGRLADLVDSESDLRAAFRRVAALVLDEADRLLDATFEPALRSIMKVLPPKRQTMLFTATMTQPLEELRGGLLNDAFVFKAYDGLRTAENLTESYVLVPAKVKEVYLMHLLGSLAEHAVKSVIVFCSTKRSCELVSGLLYQMDVAAASLYSSKKQKQRLSALNQFKGRAVNILVATDVASRGLDIPTVDLVINFDLPIKAEDYVHRVGRTARAGRKGWSVSFVSQYDVKLVHEIEATVGHQLEEYKMDEGLVMKGITKVFAARRAAMLAIDAKANVV